MSQIRRIRVLFTIPNFITAGSGQLLVDIAERLDPERFEPHICVLKAGGRLEAHICQLGIPVHELAFTAAPRPLARLPLRVVSRAQQFRPYGFDIWHSFHYADDYTEPLIARAAGAKAWVFSKKSMSWGSRAWKLRSLLATRIITLNTDMDSRFFSGRLFRTKTRYIPPGVDTALYRPAVTHTIDLRERLGLSRDVFLIGVVAHLVRVKGHPVLLRALARIPEAHLVIAGKPLEQDYVGELQRLVGELGLQRRVHFIGNVEDVPALHAELDIFVLPTLGSGRMEGCPVALLEAMACGKPSVATDIPGSRDVIEHCVSGLLVPPEDSDALSEALLRLIRSAELRARLAEGARQRILANYTIEREVAEHEALYASLL